MAVLTHKSTAPPLPSHATPGCQARDMAEATGHLSMSKLSSPPATSDSPSWPSCDVGASCKWVHTSTSTCHQEQGTSATLPPLRGYRHLCISTLISRGQVHQPSEPLRRFLGKDAVPSGRVRALGLAFSLVVKMSLSHRRVAWVQYVTPASCRCRPWKATEMALVLGPCHPHGRPGLSSCSWLWLWQVLAVVSTWGVNT